jgi:dihydroorotate dehydrogenase (NAD+) catalytic subunit
MAGASAIQVGTALFTKPNVATEIIEGLGEIMAKHNFSQISEMVGIANPK